MKKRIFNVKQQIMQKNAYLIILLGMATIILTSCNNQASESIDIEKLKGEIQKMEDNYFTSEKAKDADGVVAYYSEDAASYNRNEEPVFGKVAIKERIAKRFANDTTGNYSIYKLIDLFGDKDMLVEIGSWTTHNAAGEEVKKGHYMAYFQMRDGKYLCVRDMNVSSN